ncbi:hypothetical protein FACS1894105_11240 [Clostridia bacterium]|nr:hypothetical protein FACS1894105_11240 [Clostridia bacterium]
MKAEILDRLIPAILSVIILIGGLTGCNTANVNPSVIDIPTVDLLENTTTESTADTTAKEPPKLVIPTTTEESGETEAITSGQPSETEYPTAESSVKYFSFHSCHLNSSFR